MIAAEYRSEDSSPRLDLRRSCRCLHQAGVAGSSQTLIRPDSIA